MHLYLNIPATRYTRAASVGICNLLPAYGGLLTAYLLVTSAQGDQSRFVRCGIINRSAGARMLVSEG